MILGGDGADPTSVPLLGVNESNIVYRPSRVFVPYLRRFRFSRFVQGCDRWNIQFQAGPTVSLTVTPRLYFGVGDP